MADEKQCYFHELSKISSLNPMHKWAVSTYFGDPGLKIRASAIDSDFTVTSRRRRWIPEIRAYNRVP